MPGLGNNKNTKCCEFDGCNISFRKRAKASACCLISPARKVSVEVESRRETLRQNGFKHEEIISSDAWGGLKQPLPREEPNPPT